MVQLALRLFVLDARRDMLQQDRLSMQLLRRLRRAGGTSGLPVAADADVLQLVRHLSRQYRVERSVALGAGRGLRRGPLETLRRVVDTTYQEDADSSSSDEQ